VRLVATAILGYLLTDVINVAVQMRTRQRIFRHSFV